MKQYLSPQNLAIIISGAVILFLIGLSTGSSPSSVPLEHYAQEVLAKCRASSYRPACYDEEIPKLMDFISMEEAFEVTKLVQQQDPNYWYCHVLGHKLSAKEAAQDPAQWKNVIARCPSGMCSNGCIHGAFQERFRTDVLPDTQLAAVIPELKTVCENRPDKKFTGLEQASCYHALGHLLMYITGAELAKSNRLCREVAIKEDGRNFLEVCYDGNFMQIFQPLEPEDFALVQGKTPAQSAVEEFCEPFEKEAAESCLRESWPLFSKEIKTQEGIARFCFRSETGLYRRKCYNALFYVLPVQLKFDAAALKNLCASLPRDIGAQCYANVASRFIETDYNLIGESLAFCREAERLGGAESCYHELLFYSTYNFKPDSPEFLKLCRSFPEPWQERCFKKEAVKLYQ